jgi:hypothetical protein
LAKREKVNVMAKLPGSTVPPASGDLDIVSREYGDSTYAGGGISCRKATFDFKGYLDGQEIASITGPGAIDYGTNGPWNILENGSSFNEPFRGAMEDIRADSVVRDAAWFEDTYRRGLGLPEAV